MFETTPNEYPWNRKVFTFCLHSAATAKWSSCTPCPEVERNRKSQRTQVLIITQPAQLRSPWSPWVYNRDPLVQVTRSSLTVLSRFTVQTFENFVFGSMVCDRTQRQSNNRRMIWNVISCYHGIWIMVPCLCVYVCVCQTESNQFVIATGARLAPPKMFLARSLGSQVVGEQETLLLLGFQWDSTAEAHPTTNHQPSPRFHYGHCSFGWPCMTKSNRLGYLQSLPAGWMVATVANVGLRKTGPRILCLWIARLY